MRKVMLASVIFGGVLVLGPSPSSGFQCPTLIQQVREAARKRSDDAAALARAKAEEAARLHAQGRHAEALARARQGWDLLTKQD